MDSEMFEFPGNSCEIYSENRMLKKARLFFPPKNGIIFYLRGLGKSRISDFNNLHRDIPFFNLGSEYVINKRF